jgi:hypothetical protein
MYEQLDVAKDTPEMDTTAVETSKGNNTFGDTDVAKDMPETDATAEGTSKDKIKTETSPPKKTPKKKSSKNNTDGRTHISFRCPSEMILLIEEAQKKFELTQTELIIFAINCLVGELEQDEIQRLLEEKQKAKKFFG